MKRIHALPAVVSLVGLLAFGGCGTDPNKPKLGKVHGTVTYKGKPLDKGEVVFTPASGKGGETGQVATGKIESDGSYSLTTFNTDDGAILGQHVATVIVQSGDIKEMNKPGPGGAIPYVLPKSAIPEKYAKADSSPLRYTVNEGDNKFDIELKD